MVQYVFGL